MNFFLVISRLHGTRGGRGREQNRAPSVDWWEGREGKEVEVVGEGGMEGFGKGRRIRIRGRKGRGK